MQLQLQVTSKNTGLTPALYTHVIATLDPKMGGQKGNGVCNVARSIVIKGQHTDMVFPGATLTQPIVAKAQPEEVSAGRLKDGTFRPTVTVCVDYRSALDEPLHHQTFMTFDLSRMKLSPDGRLRLDPKDGDLAASEVDFTHRFGENFAD
jgi:hypothetical protein